MEHIEEKKAERQKKFGTEDPPKPELTEAEKKRAQREERFGKQSPPRDEKRKDRYNDRGSRNGNYDNRDNSRRGRDYGSRGWDKNDRRRSRSRSRSESKERKRSYGDNRGYNGNRDNRNNRDNRGGGDGNYQKKKYEKTPKTRAEERVRNLKKLLGDVKIKTFLDVGCGDATITVEVGKMYNVEKMYGCDVFPVSDFKEIADSANFSYHQVVDNKIPLEDGAVELVSCFVSIHHFEKFDEMAQEINRVIAPDGYLFIREHDCDQSDTKLVEYLDEMHRKFPDHQGQTYYWSKVKLREALEKNGYEYKGEDTYTTYNPQHLYHSLFKKKGKDVEKEEVNGTEPAQETA